MHRLLALSLVLATPFVSDLAHAQDYDDLDEPSAKSKKEKKGKSPAAAGREEVIREVERGLYAKASLGSTSYLLNYGYSAAIGSAVLKSGTSMGLAIGDDFVDNERNSMAWEVAFSQGVHNGANYQILGRAVSGGQVPAAAAIQGDTRTFAGLANFEYSIYPSRRLGIGFRAGGGVMLSPLLMNEEAYAGEVCQDFGGACPILDAVHRTPHPVGFGGPAFEYYTKLSHFSIGADIDAMYAVGFDLGVSASGYMKYTF